MDIGSFILYLASVFTALALLWGIAVKLVPVLRDWLARPTLHFRRLEWESKWMRDHMEIPMFKLNSDLECVEVNTALCKLLQTDEANILGRQWYGLIFQDDFEDVIEGWRQALKDHSPYRKTQRINVGESFSYFKVTGDPMIHGGRVREIMGTVRALMK